MSDLPALQQRVAEFLRAYDMEAAVETRLLDLTSEVGELAKEALKAGDYGRRSFLTSPAWADELGDVFFALVCLANSSDVDLAAALAAALAKYEQRLAARSDAGSGR